MDVTEQQQFQNPQDVYEVKNGQFIFDENNLENRNKVYFLQSGFGIRTCVAFDDDGKKVQHNQISDTESVNSNGKGPGSIIGIANVISKKKNYVTNMFVSKHNVAKFQIFAMDGSK